MTWRVEFFNIGVRYELDAMAPDIIASFLRISRLIEAHGLEKIHEPYVKHLTGPLWEMRLKGKDGIARAAYVTATGRRVVVVRVFSKKNAENAPSRNPYCPRTGERGRMSYKPISVEDAAKDWFKNREFVKAYDALEVEFTLASALIEARGRANLTQEEVASRMGTTQTAIARLEGGRSNPSASTLERYAKATGHRLRFSFVPEGEASDRDGT